MARPIERVGAVMGNAGRAAGRRGRKVLRHKGVQMFWIAFFTLILSIFGALTAFA